MTVKLLTEHHMKFLNLKGGCTGSSESTLVKMPRCWKSHVTAQLAFSFHLVVYRHSFRQTFAEVYAPTGEWKSSLTIVIATITATLFGVLWLHYFGKYIIQYYTIIDFNEVDMRV